jgi:exonuclease III
MVLIILQWNARSLIANGQEFKKYIDNLIEKPHIICIQETWLKPQLDFIIKGYNVIRNDREYGRGGGIATFIQNGMKYKVVQINTDYESIINKIWTERGCIDIINYYNPCKKLSQNILEDVVGPIQDSVIWCGDFNSQNSLWGSNSTDANGLLIEEFIDIKYLVCINNGEGTRFNSINNTETAIDLTFVSSSIAGVSTWSVRKHTTVGSDHYPVMTKIGTKICYEKEKRIPRWKLEKVNWEVFQEICEKRCLTLQVENQMDVNIFNNKLVNEIIQSAEEIIPKSTGVRCTKNVPWWNNDCKEAIKARNKAFRQLKKHHSQDTLILYKRAQAKVRKTIKAQKRTFWRQYCNSIGREVQVSDVWGMIRRMGGIRRNYELPVLNSGDKIAVNNLEKAELLVQIFKKVHSSDNLSEVARQCRNKTLMEFPNILKKNKMSKNPLDLPLNIEFTFKRLS